MIDRFAIFCALQAMGLFTSPTFITRVKQLVKEEMQNPMAGGDMSTIRTARREFGYSDTVTKAVIMIVLIWVGERLGRSIKEF